MTNPNKNISSSSQDAPCAKKLDSAAVTKGKKKESCKKATEKEAAKSQKADSACKSPDDEQARLNKSPCPADYSAPQCDKERSIPPNPRKKMQKNDTKTDETKEDDTNPCASPCFKTG